MNQRILELAIDAGIVSAEYNGFDPTGLTKAQRKFAELIIRECAGLAVNSQYANTKSEYYEGFNEALVYVGNKFKQHFGVEE